MSAMVLYHYHCRARPRLLEMADHVSQRMKRIQAFADSTASGRPKKCSPRGHGRPLRLCCTAASPAPVNTNAKGLLEEQRIWRFARVVLACLLSLHSYPIHACLGGLRKRLNQEGFGNLLNGVLARNARSEACSLMACAGMRQRRSAREVRRTLVAKFGRVAGKQIDHSNLLPATNFSRARQCCRETR